MPSAVRVPTHRFWKGTKGNPSLPDAAPLPPTSSLHHKHLQLSSDPHQLILHANPRENELRQDKCSATRYQGCGVSRGVPPNARHHPHGLSSRRCLTDQKSRRSRRKPSNLPRAPFSGQQERCGSTAPTEMSRLALPSSADSRRGGGNIRTVNYLPANPQAGPTATGLIGQPPTAPPPPHMPEASAAFQPAAEGACFPNSRHNAATHRAERERQCQTQCPEYINK